MKSIPKILLLGVSITVLISLTVPVESPLSIDFVREAGAIIGLPFTPLSYAGVARRTCRRTARRAFFYAPAVVAVGTAAAVDATPPAAPVPGQAPAPVHHAAAPPIGTIVTTLPHGCASSPRGGVEFYDCGGVYYRPAFQSGNLVYVVQNPE